jgi:hypothetical protein
MDMDQPTNSPHALHGQLVRTLAVGAAFIGLCAVGASFMLDRAAREHSLSTQMRTGGAAVDQRYVAAPSQPVTSKNSNTAAIRWPWGSRYDMNPTASIGTKPAVKNVITDPNAGMPQ